MGAHAISKMGQDSEPTALDDVTNRVAILAELEAVVTHTTFRDTKRLKRFLSYVVTETLDGRADRLKGYTLGLEVFDRGDDFDPQGDTIVRVQAGQLRRRLDLYYAQDGAGNAVRILLPKGKYIPTFEFRRDISQAQLRSIPKLMAQAQTDGKTDTMARPGVLVPSIANLSGDDKYGYFAEGLTSEIVNALVQFRYLRIITGTPMVDTTTAMSNKLIAAEYGAQFILSGHIRRIKDKVRVSVNLIKADTGAHLMSKKFDRMCTGDNLFEIQEEIASYVAAAVATPNGAVNRYNRRVNLGRRADMRGYDALLKFFDVRAEQNRKGVEALIAEFDEVLEATPKFSSGWAAKSLLHSYLVGQAVPNIGAEDNSEQALLAAKRAVTLHSENALAYFASFMAHFFAGNIEEYEQDAARALALNPNDYTILLYYAQTRCSIGDIENAVIYANAAQALITLPTHWHAGVEIFRALMAGDYSIATDRLKHMSPRTPVGALMCAIAAAGHAGDLTIVEPIKAELLEQNPNYARDVLVTFLRWNPRADFYEVFRSGIEKAGFPNTPKQGELL